MAKTRRTIIFLSLTTQYQIYATQRTHHLLSSCAYMKLVLNLGHTLDLRHFIRALN